MKMKNFVLGSFLVVSSAVFAAPVVSDISCQQGAGNWINITYALSEPAVVTISIETNRGDGVWVPIPAEARASIEASANRLVDTAGTHTVKWRPYKSAQWPKDREDFRFSVKAWSTNMPPPYMVVNLLKPKGNVHYYASADEIPGGITSVVSKTEQMVFRRIDAAGVEWVMGEPKNAAGLIGAGDSNAGRAFAMPVVLTNDYYCAIFPVTRVQYKFLTGAETESRSYSDNDMKPVDDPQYSAWRGAAGGDWPGWPTMGHAVKDGSVLANAREKYGVEFDFPTSAQREYACRAGTTTSLNNGHNVLAVGTSTNADDVAWYSGNCTTHQVVGLKKPNAWRLYDMHGNRMDWCLDWAQDYRITNPGQDLLIEPVGALTDKTTATYSGRVVRGGYAGNNAMMLMSGYWYSFSEEQQGAGISVRLCAPCRAVK